MRILWTLSVLLGLLGRAGAAWPQTAIVINLASAAPGYSLDEVWASPGVDPQGRVYIAVTSRYTLPAGNPGDVVFIRYDPATGNLTLLGTARNIATASGNLQSSERIAKVHTDFLNYQGKMYVATHDFHSDPDPGSTQRGSHIFRYDPATNQWADLSVGDPNGITAPGQGMLGFDVLSSDNKLAGLTYPSGQVVIFDLALGRTATLSNAPVSFAGVSRKIWAASNGKAYITYLPGAPACGSCPTWSFYPWEANARTGGFVQGPTSNMLYDGALYRAVHTRDESRVWIKDEVGHLYRFTVATNQLTEVSNGSILPSGADVDPTLDYTLGLSNDEQYIFSIPNDNTGSTFQSGTLYQFRISDGQKTAVTSFANTFIGDIFGLAVDQQGNLYASNHDYGTEGTARLIKISGVPNSPPSTPPAAARRVSHKLILK